MDNPAIYNTPGDIEREKEISMATDRFPDLPAILERLPEAKRAELGIVRKSKPAPYWRLPSGRGHDEATLADHYAVLSVVLIELNVKHDRFVRYMDWDEGTEWTVFQGDRVDGNEAVCLNDSGSIFTAAAAAYWERAMLTAEKRAGMKLYNQHAEGLGLATVFEADEDDYDTACGRLGRWLMEHNTIVRWHGGGGMWTYQRWDESVCKWDSGCRIDCPDDELTAMTHAALAVKGEKL